MAVRNNLAKANARPSFAAFIKSDGVMNNLTKTLGSESKKSTFVTSIVSAVNQNAGLQDCDFNSIVSGALLGESLNLSPSPQLGHYYLVPFNDKNKGKVATFQLGYKGMVQLAIRSGQYKRLNVLAIKEGELIKYDPLTEEVEVKMIDNEETREKTPTIGYYATFELVNGFTKTLYWTKAKMEAHALRYSAGYKAKKGYTFWEKSFDDMACKTMLRQLLSKWGIMSIELQKAYTDDMTFKTDLKEESEATYFDNQVSNDVYDVKVEEITGEDLL